MDFSPDPSICTIDLALVEDFAAAAEAYLETVKFLQDCKRYEDILRAFEASELARRDCVAAREAVERHRREHGFRRVGFRKERA
jgi:hypothetical protein